MAGSARHNCVQNRTTKIRALNDSLRKTGVGGRLVMTQGVASLPQSAIGAILAAVAGFEAFSDSNDPYGEHDMGAIRVGVHLVFFKIDYYDEQLMFASDDPSDPAITQRVLTIMLTSEY